MQAVLHRRHYAEIPAAPRNAQNMRPGSCAPSRRKVVSMKSVIILLLGLAWRVNSIVQRAAQYNLGRRDWPIVKIPAVLAPGRASSRVGETP